MKKVMILLLAIALVCCKDKKDAIVKLEEAFVVPRVFSNEGFEPELRDWITWVSTYMDSLYWDEMCYTVEFFVDSMDRVALGNDTLIVMSYYTSGDSYPGFKGVASFGVNTVAIVDKSNAGERYYDSQLLKMQPLDSFRQGLFIANRRAVRYLKLTNGKLIRKKRLSD